MASFRQCANKWQARISRDGFADQSDTVQHDPAILAPADGRGPIDQVPGRAGL
jgi:hypothetical protein